LLARINLRRVVNIGAFLTFLSLSIGILVVVFTPPAAAQHHGAPPPPASLGDRKVALNFESNPKIIDVNQTANISINFEDLAKKQNIQHVTFRLEILKNEKTIFTDFFHGHNGQVNLRIRSNNQSPPSVNGNFDTLTNAWLADPESPIVINGKIFSIPGIYKTIVEVTTIDNDKTDLPTPLKYQFNIPVFASQSITADYQGTKFNIGTLSPFQLTDARLVQEKKQLVVTSNDTIDAHNPDFSMRIDLPKEMMSGPFVATLEDGTKLNITENGTNTSTRSLIITSMHNANMTQTDEASSNTTPNNIHTIYISATNVVPEFPMRITAALSGLAIATTISIIRKSSRASPSTSSLYKGKTY
jgi:hypothetical protein